MQKSEQKEGNIENEVLIEIESYLGLSFINKVYHSFSCEGAKVGARDLLCKVKLDVTLLEVVVVYFDWAANRIILQVNLPVGEPFATPEILEIQVVARNFYMEDLILHEYTKGGSTLPELSVSIFDHCFNSILPKFTQSQ